MPKLIILFLIQTAAASFAQIVGVAGDAEKFVKALGTRAELRHIRLAQGDGAGPVRPFNQQAAAGGYIVPENG